MICSCISLLAGLPMPKFKAMQSTLKITLFFFFMVSLLLLVSPCLSFTSFVFGDSLVDAGNNDYLFTLSKADSPPYGIDFTPSGGRPTGRFTNGRTISDILGIKTMHPLLYCFSHFQ